MVTTPKSFADKMVWDVSTLRDQVCLRTAYKSTNMMVAIMMCTGGKLSRKLKIENKKRLP